MMSWIVLAVAVSALICSFFRPWRTLIDCAACHGTGRFEDDGRSLQIGQATGLSGVRHALMATQGICLACEGKGKVRA